MKNIIAEINEVGGFFKWVRFKYMNLFKKPSPEGKRRLIKNIDGTWEYTEGETPEFKESEKLIIEPLNPLILSAATMNPIVFNTTNEPFVQPTLNLVADADKLANKVDENVMVPDRFNETQTKILSAVKKKQVRKKNTDKKTVKKPVKNNAGKKPVKKKPVSKKITSKKKVIRRKVRK